MVLETARLRLRRFAAADAAFVLRLLNEPSFVRNVGDRGVRTVEDAAAYIRGGPIASYAHHGFGLYLVELKDGTPIGTCGVLKRDELPDADIGYSLLPEFWSQGFAYEAATAIRDYARSVLGLDRLLAIVSPENDPSARLLEKLGFTFERMVELGDKETLKLFALALEPRPNPSLLGLVESRRGHFRLESGLHGAAWFDLEGLFADPKRLAPHVEALARALRRHDPGVVCGPLAGGALLAQLVAQALGIDFAFTERHGAPTGSALFTATYRLPAALARRVAGRRVALVDDAMSAGSSLRATCAELQQHGALPVVVGSLLVLGSAGEEFFTHMGVPVEALMRDAYECWTPASCPMCAAGTPLEDPVSYASAAGGA